MGEYLSLRAFELMSYELVGLMNLGVEELMSLSGLVS